ncbi:MAG: hypothetical protein Ct9H300mP7_2140 [Verrucomicrobiota bacterium]|nr:MAG: hypothetical protein Ct9H300mP7_2140 [Verrucomicrobiota bacterium]
MVGVGGKLRGVTVDDWRWVMLMGSAPIVLGLLVPLIVPESPRWLPNEVWEIQKKLRRKPSLM